MWLSECEFVLICTEFKAQRSEKLPVKQKCQSLFTRLCRKYCTGYKILTSLAPCKLKINYDIILSI